jgi:hypothetical protein
MYPLKAILVGDAAGLGTARQELRAHRVEIEAELPDAAATVEWLAQAPEARRLFVLYLAGPDQPERVKRLRGCCRGQPILGVVAEPEANKEQLIRLMRAGIDQAVLLPSQSADFRAALESLAWEFGYAAPQSVAVSVIGVTPGSGATTVAVNLAYEISHYCGRNCILVEAATRLGKLAAGLGVTPRFTTCDLVNAGGRLDVHMMEQALIPVADRYNAAALNGPITQPAPPAADPLAALPPPSFSAYPVQSASALNVNGTVTLQPGVYVGGIAIAGGNVTLQPGIYLMNGGGFKINNGTVNGAGVMIYNGADSTHTAGVISIAGGATVNLSPPTSGTYAGVTLFQDRQNTQKMVITANHNKNIPGAIYAPAAEVDLAGPTIAGTMDILGGPVICLITQVQVIFQINAGAGGSGTPQHLYNLVE